MRVLSLRRLRPRAFCVVAVVALATSAILAPAILSESVAAAVPPGSAYATPSTHTSRAALDNDAIHIVQTYCIINGIERTDAGLTTLRSILAARASGPSRSRRYVFHILADEWVSWLIAYNSSTPLPFGKHLKNPESLDLFHELWGDVLANIEADPLLELHVHTEDDVYAATEATLGRGALGEFNHDGFRRVSRVG